MFWSERSNDIILIEDIGSGPEFDAAACTGGTAEERGEVLEVGETQYGDLHLQVSTTLVSIGSEFPNLRVLGVRGDIACFFNFFYMLFGCFCLQQFLYVNSPRVIVAIHIERPANCCFVLVLFILSSDIRNHLIVLKK